MKLNEFLFVMFIFALIVFVPIYFIWTLNTLFPALAIGYTFKTWGAAWSLIIFIAFFSEKK